MKKIVKTAITGWNCSLVGFAYFLSKPKLWIGPLLTTLFCWVFLFLAFVITTYFSWPSSELAWGKYTLKIFQALGFGSIFTLFLWAFVLPCFFNWAFESMIKKIFLSKGEDVADVSLIRSFLSGFYIIRKTLLWRVFWIGLALIFTLFFGVVGFLIAQMAFGHIALLDACDLSLSIKGLSGKNRYHLLKENTLALFSGGLISGLFNFVLVPTVIGWIFYLPGIYAGCALWTRFWEMEKP